MVLTDAQIAQLKQIVADYHTAFLINFYGPKTVPPEVVAKLKEKGLVTLQGNTAQDAYLYGRVLQQLNTPQAAQMSFPAFQAYVRKNPIPLSPIEEHAVSIAAARGAQYVVGLGNTVSQDTGRVAIEADAQLRRLMKESIKTTVSQGIAERKTVKDIKSNLGHLTKDWTRDLDRIAATEVSLAMNEGMATEVRAQHGDDAEVAVRSRRGCCPECEKAYKGEDGAPIIFRLTDLEANGTNYKKKKADKLPVVPPYHPNCVAQGTQVLTAHGLEAIEHITPGTLVYTHLGQLRPVTHTWATWLDDDLYTLSAGKGPSLSLTGNHEVHNGLHFTPAASLTDKSALVRVSHVVQPPYIEDHYIDEPRAYILSGFFKNGAAVNALILPSGIFVCGAVYDLGGDKRKALMPGLRGRVQFYTKADIPALGVSDLVKSTDRRFCGLGGTSVCFRKIDGAYADHVLNALSFFQREFVPGAKRLTEPSQLMVTDSADGVPTIAWVKMAAMGCRKVGLAGYDLAPVTDFEGVDGHAELITESITAVSKGKYRGLVFNLTVAQDESYIANGIVVHNCACALVHVPKGHGFTDDNRMSPVGKRGIRPHAETTKSMLALGEQLNKADPTHRRVLDWAGLRLRTLKRHDAGHWDGALLTPAGAVPCLVGPASMASDAYIAHLPSGDHVMVGFPHAQSAATALNTYHQDKAMMAFPGHTAWSKLPVVELAAYSRPGATDMFVMPGLGGSVGAQAEPLVRSDKGKRPESRLKPVGRLVIPIKPPSRLPTPPLESPYQVLPDLGTPDGQSNREVKKMPMTAPWAMQAQVRPIHKPTFILGKESPPDEELTELIADTAKMNIKREPITDIGETA